MNASLRNRIRRLEERYAVKARPSCSERLLRAQQRWDELNPQQQAAKSLTSARAALARPEPQGNSPAARLSRAERRWALDHLARLAQRKD